MGENLFSPATHLCLHDSYKQTQHFLLEFDGSGLAPTLDYLREAAPEEYQSLEKMLQRIVPSVQKLGVRRAKVMVNRQRLIEVDGKSISYEESQEMTGQEVVLELTG